MPTVPLAEQIFNLLALIMIHPISPFHI
ncbi:protein of unknown function (plasmid) [Caballeronia sp. S22]